MGFEKHPLDDAVYFDKFGTIILVYVDDLIVLGGEARAQGVLKQIRNRFKATDPVSLATASASAPLVFLSHEMWLEQNQSILVVHQHSYVDSLLERCEVTSGLRNFSAKDYEHGSFDESPLLDPTGHKEFRSKLGAMSYLAHATRPDLLTPVSVLAEAQAAPTSRHLDVLNRLLRYLFTTRHRHLRLNVATLSPDKAKSVPLQLFFDASYCSSYARSGAVLMVDSVPTYWYSRKQKCITLSTCGAELVSASQGAKELAGAWNFLKLLFPDITFSLELLGDSTAANLISSSQASPRKVRHLSLAHLFVRDLTRDGLLAVTYVETSKNPADIFTKPLPEVNLQPHLKFMSIGNSGPLTPPVGVDSSVRKVMYAKALAVLDAVASPYTLIMS